MEELKINITEAFSMALAVVKVLILEVVDSWAPEVLA
jgi:hypothetical protein